VAVRSISDWRAGAQPDPRIHMSTRTDGRDFAVLLLVDLSQSVNDALPGSDDTRAVTEPARPWHFWRRAIAALGDQLAIAGFHSNTRHEVRYLHIKGFSERWGDAPKGAPGRHAGRRTPTRMGAALRHAAPPAHRRARSRQETAAGADRRPARRRGREPTRSTLIADAAQAVRELDPAGAVTATASAWIRRPTPTWGKSSAAAGPWWTGWNKLPERLPRLFMALTR
jgi:nitric oxide reductase NorD protein